MLGLKNETLAPSAAKVLDANNAIIKFVQDNATKQDVMEMAARDLAFSLCRTYTGALLVDHACSNVSTPQDVYVAQRWCEKDLSLVKTNAQLGQYSGDSTKNDFDLVYDCYHEGDRL
ncbi:acyl-CoA dehydrogenase family member 11-like [Ruditapes philippinarum]|uniref:acyl-CoA dehydrogenase family member 11-like n=1 Tax=Ruditapes philippinarum TaxID=129788 RepID=UPI00295A73C8|nr:acyl-CoA dehydrogenase family member 11-like [Ruditapes philippinarum]